MSRLTDKLHPLITEEVLDKLKKHKIYNTIHFMDAKAKAIESFTKLKYKEIIRLKQHFYCELVPISNALKVHQNLMKNKITIRTGFESLDDILQGGFTNHKVYELCGYPGSGKSLFCLNLVKNYLKNLDGIVYYIDTKRDFNAKKLKQIIELEEQNKHTIIKSLKRVCVKQCATKFDLLNVLYDLKHELDTTGVKVHLVIIDSLPAGIYTSVNCKRDGHLLRQIAHIIQTITATNHVAFVITNFISRIIHNNESTDKIESGKYWERQPNTRLRIDKFEDHFKVKIQMSLDSHANKTAVFNM